MINPARHYLNAPSIHRLALAMAAAEQVSFGLALEISLARAADEPNTLTPPAWIPLFPAPDASHRITARDGRSWTLRDPAVVLAHFTANAADLPLDLEHATELLAPKGHPAPAQAWIKELRVNPDRSIWGRPEWTPAGLASYRTGGWRYISPAILHSEAGDVLGLSSAGLVTRPALNMPALARDGGRNPSPQQESSMTTIALATLIGVAGLAATASEADALAAITANAQAARDLKDPSKFVPATDLTAALARATTAETKLGERDATDKEAAAVALVEGGIAAGKIVPASKDHFLAMAREAPTSFETALASMPVILKPTETAKKVEGGADTDADGLTPDQVALCGSLGLDRKAFAATLKETA